MARLPDPVLENIKVEWSDKEETTKREKEFYGILGVAIRRATSDKSKEDNKN